MSKRAEVCTSIITANGNEVFGDDCVRNAYRNEFQQRLEMEEGSSDMKEYQKKTKLVTDMLMFKLTEAKEENFRWEELSKVLKTIKRGKAVGLDEIPGEVLADCSKEVENAMLSAMNDIKKKHEIPKQWERVSITTIYKEKGSQKELVNHRGIFLTPVLSKVFERLICLRIEPFMERMSKFQAGSRKNRSVMDQLFILRSLTNHAIYLKSPLYITFYDFKQCFDKLGLDDSMLALWKLGVETEMLPLIRKMNSQAEISVKTPMGFAESFNIKSLVKQGTVIGPLLCSASIAEFCEECGPGGAGIGKTTIRTLAFVDDIININSDVVDVLSSHERIKCFSEKKNLPLSPQSAAYLH